MQISEIIKIIDIDIDIDKDFNIKTLNTLKDAKADNLSFFDGNSKYEQDLPSTKAGAVLLESKYANSLPKGTLAITTDEPYLKLAIISKYFVKPIISNKINQNISPNANIDDNVFLGDNVTIKDGAIVLPNVYIGNSVTIEENSIIYPNVSIYADTLIGKNVIIHANSVIGSDGFGFAHTKNAEHVKIYHLGNVVIEDFVEIGSNTSIDKAVFGETRIKKGTKIDNLVHIAHNCIIGENSLLTAQVGLAGSCELGKNVSMGGQSGSAGHLKIGDFSTIVAKSGVTKTLKGKNYYAGFPAIDYKMWRKMQAKLSIFLKQI
jgi:UDP-3-O-[3-hydroxymyristoyl] glucosamine N-acyltransferase